MNERAVGVAVVGLFVLVMVSPGCARRTSTALMLKPTGMAASQKAKRDPGKAVRDAISSLKRQLRETPPKSSDASKNQAEETAAREPQQSPGRSAPVGTGGGWTMTMTPRTPEPTTNTAATGTPIALVGPLPEPSGSTATRYGLVGAAALAAALVGVLWIQRARRTRGAPPDALT